MELFLFILSHVNTFTGASADREVKTLQSGYFQEWKHTPLPPFA